MEHPIDKYFREQELTTKEDKDFVTFLLDTEISDMQSNTYAVSQKRDLKIPFLTRRKYKTYYFNFEKVMSEEILLLSFDKKKPFYFVIFDIGEYRKYTPIVAVGTDFLDTFISAKSIFDDAENYVILVMNTLTHKQVGEDEITSPYLHFYGNEKYTGDKDYINSIRYFEKYNLDNAIKLVKNSKIQEMIKSLKYLIKKLK